MKFREYFSLYKELLKSRSLVILRCPYCDSFNIHYFKDTLEEKQFNDYIVVKNIKYGISCNNCNSVAMISECWNNSLRKEYEE